MIFDDLRPEAVADHPTREPGGRPWTSWVKKGGYQGWRAGGRAMLPGGRFWEQTLSIAGEYFGAHANDVHCLGPGILSVGVLGATFQSGYGQRLLQQCLLTDPVRFVNVMAPLLQETGARTKTSEKSPSGVALVDARGTVVVSEPALREIVLLGADAVTWTSAQKDRARLWVSSVSELLRDEHMDRAQAEFAAEVLPSVLHPEVQRGLRWSGNADDTWQYTKELQAVWSFAFVASAGSQDTLTDLLWLVINEVPEEAAAEVLLHALCRFGAGWHHLLEIVCRRYGIEGIWNRVIE